MDILSTLGVFLTGAAVLLAVYTYKRQMNAQLFLEYTRRYEEVMQAYPEDSRTFRLRADESLPPEKAELTAVVLRYLNLCSEEFYLWKRGYLSTDIWEIWEKEMCKTLASPLFRREWPKVSDEFGTYSEFAQYVRNAQQRSTS